jgi:hypothetical protein
VIALAAHGFGLVLLTATALGAVAAFLSALGASRIYERVGRGYLDVGDADPVVQSGTEPLEVTDVREMLEATDAMRQSRGERARAVQERIAELLEELERR